MCESRINALPYLIPYPFGSKMTLKFIEFLSHSSTFTARLSVLFLGCVEILVNEHATYVPPRAQCLRNPIVSARYSAAVGVFLLASLAFSLARSSHDEMMAPL